MTRKSRYLILLAGFIVFIILAPLIVLYVRGITYDFATNSFVSTGIFGIRAEPQDAEILLNGKLKRTGAGDINFLLPGEYQITLKKSGYNDWNKRLDIRAGEVTWVNPANNSIYLLLNSPTPKILGQNVLDYYNQNNNLCFLTADGITAGGQHYSLPENVNAILAHDNSAQNFILANASSAVPTLLYFNSAGGKITDLSALFPALPKIQFGDNGNLFALSEGGLYQINAVKQTKQLLFQSVQSFYYQDGNLYYIQKTAGPTATLFAGQEPFSQSQQILAGIPSFNQGDLFVSSQKRIFLQADGSLYQINGSLQKIADGGQNVNFQDSAITLSQAGEFDYLDGYGGNLNFVTRSSEPFTGLDLKNNIGYAFYSAAGRLTAIELDSRGSQNQYVLYSGQNIQKFSVDSSGQNITLLDNGELKSITIR